MALTLTLTISTADQLRLSAALAATGVTDPSAMIVARLRQIVSDYETAQETMAVAAVMPAFIAGYVPIAPVAVITVSGD